jgi:hypothetical protein
MFDSRWCYWLSSSGPAVAFESTRPVTENEYQEYFLDIKDGRCLGLTTLHLCRSQWPRGLRRRSAAAHLLRSWVRIAPGAWKFVCCECCVLSGRVLCDDLIIHPEESYRVWCVVVCDLETSTMRRPWPALGRSAKEKKIPYILHVLSGNLGHSACWNPQFLSRTV